MLGRGAIAFTLVLNAVHMPDHSHAWSEKRKDKSRDNLLEARHCAHREPEYSTDCDNDRFSLARRRHKRCKGLPTPGIHVTDTGYGSRRRCHGGDSSVDSRSKSKDSSRSSRRNYRIEVSSSDVDDESGDFH